MTRGPLNHRFSALVSLAVSLVSLRYGLTIVRRNKLLWISTVAMAFMLRQVLQKRSSQLVTDHSVVGKKLEDTKEENSKEYDFVIVGGGGLPYPWPGFTH